MEGSVSEQINEMGRRARAASRELAKLGTAARRDALFVMADAIEEATDEILSANENDVVAAVEAGLTKASIDRLRLDGGRLAGVAAALRSVATLPDPVGAVISRWERPNGLEITKVRTPIGVVGIIYESRPNVTADAASLCVKTGNAVILRGGSESLRSNIALADALRRGASRSGLPTDAIQLVPFADREAVRAMARMDEWLDVIVPRGGHALIEAVVAEARMPVIKHYNGICTVYVDAAADATMAAAVAVNSKCQRPGVCNAMETLLVHRNAAGAFWDAALPGFAAHHVEIRADSQTMEALQKRGYAHLVPVKEEDWTTEFLEQILAVKTVESLDEAIHHVNTFGSHHSDSIVTGDSEAAERFLAEVDSAAVYWNASTRFTDGGEFGFGAEVGISTDKLHARGPMGLEELTTYKYVVRGNGQVRS
ncbi:MAG: glutamate-5-semialdehyde dehydrogenase [Terrimicrobiaceae bacterium]